MKVLVRNYEHFKKMWDVKTPQVSNKGLTFTLIFSNSSSRLEAW